MKETNTHRGPRTVALWGVFFLSGIAALGLQVIWSKMLALSLGYEFRGVVAVIAAFFGGMALGGALSTRYRFTVPTLELSIGLWAALSANLLPLANEYWLFKLGPFASALGVFFLLLPATTAMGATLPAMSALAASAGSTRATRTAYAGNTLGGVIGCLGAAYFLMPSLSLPACVRIFATLNLLAATLAYSVQISFERRNRRQEILTNPQRSWPQRIQNLLPSIPTGYTLALFVTGFVALGFETVGVRLLSQSLENTVYTFATILAIYLGGHAFGAALFRRWRPPFWILFTALALSIGASAWVFALSPDLYDALRKWLGDSASAVAWSECLVALAVFGLPTLLMGAVFADLIEKTKSLGDALFWNSLGAGLGAVLAPIILLPQVGGFLARAPEGQKSSLVRAGAMATVMVTEAPDGHRTLFVNNRFQMGGTAARIPELRQGHIPLLLATRRERALFLGVGTGLSLSAAGAYDGLVADGVELLPEVVEVIPKFVDLPTTNLKVHVADARRFIRQTTNRYDVIVGELFHPAQDGAGFLYAVEHFRRIRERLSEGGLFCQWLPLHQIDLGTFRTIANTFLSVYPEAEVFLLRFNIDAPVVGLVGWNRRANRSSDAIEGLSRDPKLGPELRRVALADSIRLMGCLLADNEQVRRFASGGGINSDAFPRVIFEAPGFSYLRTAPTHERLMAFLDLIGDRAEDTFPSSRHFQFAKARDIYLRALVLEANGDSARALEGYLASARVSEDFTSGYAQCLAIATSESKTKPEAARRILERLIEAQPNRPVAKDMLDRLAAPAPK